jgi:potassium-transporting ATPase KdpC subunit
MFAHSLRMLGWMIFLTGGIYPLVMTFIVQSFIPYQANGSMIAVHGKTIGSRLIGQKFHSEKYFWGRPSANDYDAQASGGSNLGPISSVLKKLIMDRKAYLLKTNGGKGSEVPSDLLFASGSGLDPHISVEAAHFQQNRVSKARGFNEASAAKLGELIEHLAKDRQWGFLGAPCINVLELNLALDEVEKSL